MEPFRAPLSEGLAVYLFTSRRLKDAMFSPLEDGAIMISKDGRGALIEGYEGAVGRRVNRPDGKGKLAWRPMMRQQALSVAEAVLVGDPDLFIPYLMEA